MAVILLVIGLIVLAYLFLLIRQWRTTRQMVAEDKQKPIVPVSLVESDDAVIVAEGRGRLVYVNDHAREWFGLNGNEPNLTLMAERVKPQDTFRDLFAREGRVAFRIGQRQVEATSHGIPTDNGRRMVVVMRQHTPRIQAQEDFDPVHAMSIMGEISVMLAQSFELDHALENILQNIREIVPYDASEITQWQPDQTVLRPMARLGDPNYAAAVDKVGGVYHLDEGFSGWIARYRQPLVVADVNVQSDVMPKVTGYPFSSYIGVPLLAGERFIGTLELASRQRNQFDYDDLTLLQTLGGQVAVALENARLYTEQSNRMAELSGLQRIAQAMGALTEPLEMFNILNSSLAQLMNVEMCGVMLFDTDENMLIGQSPLYGVPEAIIPMFRLHVSPGSEGYRLWQGHDQPWWYTNAAFNDEQIKRLKLAQFVEISRIHSLAIMPMVVGNKRIGAVLAANPRDGGGFTEEDMRLMQVFAAQAAIVVENARLYHAEQRRAEELEGMQQIAQAIGALRDPSQLYTQITRHVAELMNARAAGVFLYVPDAQALISQPPFYGIDTEAIRFSQIALREDSPLYETWEQQSHWLSNDFTSSALIMDTELASLVEQAQLSKGILTPLQVGGQMIGMLLVADKASDANFDEDDARLLDVFAGQVAVLIDNARLYEETSERAEEAEALRKIAEMLASAVDLDSVIQDVLGEVAALVSAEVVGVALLDSEEGNLVYTPEYSHGGEALGGAFTIDIFSPGFTSSVVLSRRPFISNNWQQDDHILPPYRQIGERLKIYNAATVPLIFQNRSIGEITAANKVGGVFTRSDQGLLQAIAAQISAAIDRSRLYQSTDADLRARVEELNALDRISHELAQSLDLDRILDVARSEISRSTPAEGVAALLLAPQSDWLDKNMPMIEKRMSDAPQLRHHFAPLEVQAYEQGKGVYISDYLGADMEAVPPDARSAVVEPIIIDGEVVGLLHAYTSKPDSFASGDRDFVTRVTQQSALAVANARRYREQIRLNEALQARTEQLTKVYALGQMVRQGADLPTVLTRLARQVAESVGFEIVLINVHDEENNDFYRVAKFGIPDEEFAELQQHRPTHENVGRIIRDEYQLHHAYFVPVEAQGEDTWHGMDMHNPDFQKFMQGERVWDPADVLLMPIRTTDNDDDRLLGWISVDKPTSARRPTMQQLEALDIFATEAAFIIENYRLLERIREEAAGTRAERDRLAQLHLVASRISTLPDIPSRLQVVAEGIQAAGWQKVRITMRDESLDPNLLVHAGYNDEEARRLPGVVLAGRIWRERFADPGFEDLKLGAGYYLRYDHPWVQENIFRGRKPKPEQVEPDEWHPQDIVYLPLYGQDHNRILGMIGMEQPLDGQRPTEATMQPIELFASQAAAAIENTRLYLETVRQAETEQRLTDMMEAMAASLDMDAVIRTLAEGLQQMIAFTRMHVAIPVEHETAFELQRVEVTADQKVHLFNDKPVEMQKTAIGRAFETNQPHIYRLTSEESAEGMTDLLRFYDQGERITLIVPMIAGGHTLGVLRLGSELEDAFGFEEHRELVGRMANQFAISIDHSRLVNDLMSSTAYNEAIVESIQQGIVVLDTQHDIQTINAFMQLRYGWDPNAVGKNLYAYQPEFRDFLQHSIAMAIEEGTPQHQFEIQDVDAEGNKVIRNFYTYPLRQGERVSGVVLLVEDVTERAILESDLAQRAEQLGALTRVSSRITSTLATDDVIGLVLEALESVMPFDGVSLWLREGKRLNIVAARGYRDPGAASADELVGLYVEIENSALFREMADNRQVLNVVNTSTDDRFPYGDEHMYKNWLGAPLVSQGEVVGVIALEKREAYYYRSHHEQLLQAFANQAAVALYNAQLFEQTTDRAAALDAQTRRLSLLNRVAVSLAQSLDIENILEITLRETAQALDLQEAVAIKIDHENEIGRVVVEYPRSEYEPHRIHSIANNQAIARVRETLLPLMVDHLQGNTLGNDLKPWLRRADEADSALLVPLVVGGTVIGAMVFVAFSDDADFSSERIDLAQTLASQAAIAVQNASLFEQSVIRTHELETLFEAAQAIAVTLDLDEAMRRVVNQMLSALRADACSITLWDDIENKLEVREAINAWGDADEVEAAGTVYDLHDYPVRERALRQREVTVLRQSQSDIHDSELDSMRRKGASDRILVPLVVNDISIGLIELEIREQNRYFEANDVRLARTLSSQAAVAIENARLQTETRSHIEELYIINDLSTAVASTVKVDDLFPMVRDQLPVLTDAEILYVALYDEASQQLTFPVAVKTGANGSGEVQMQSRRLGDDEFSFVIKRKAPLLLAGSNLAEARTSYGVIDPMLSEAKCFLGVPLTSGDQVVGVLAVQDNDDPRAFGLNDQRILTTVASQLGVAIYNARLFDQTRQMASELEQRVEERTHELEQERNRVETLYEITAEVAASLDISRVLSRALEKVATAIGATSAVILGIDEVSDRLYVLHSWGDLPPVDHELERTQLRQDEGLAGWIIQNRQGVVIHDVRDDERWHRSGDRDENIRSAVGSLLEVGDDVRGVMMLFSNQLNAFNPNHLKLISAAASQLANSMNNAELYSLIRDQAERLGAILRTEQVESIKNAAILDSVADGVMYANEHGTVVLFNTAAESVLGLPADRVVNRPITELVGIYGTSGRDWLDYIEEWMSDPAAYRGGDFVESTLELDDGRVINVRLSPVNMGDQFLGTVSVFRDVTKAVEVDKLKTEFVATVSHELRTPMTAIKGYADLLLLGAAGEISEAQHRFLDTIKTNADRLSILVNDLLEVSRIDQNRVPLRFTAVNVDELLDGIEAHLNGRIQDKNRDLSVVDDVPENLPPVRADYDRIIQIMQNLADNAFNYTPDGGTITLQAVHDEEAQMITMSVQDTGIGIPNDVGERVFERFFRGEEYAEVVIDTPGTGLGLSIVKSLVELHQGSIWYESEVGQGTTFYVKIPVHHD